MGGRATRRHVVALALAVCGCADEVTGTSATSGSSSDEGSTTDVPSGETSSSGGASSSEGTSSSSEGASSSSEGTSSSSEGTSSSSEGTSSSSETSSSATSSSESTSSGESGWSSSESTGESTESSSGDAAGSESSTTGDGGECGDGVVGAGEECDEADALDGDGCDSDCTFTRAVEVIVGGQHTCVRLDGQKVRCWGGNGFGQLGLGNTASIGDDELPSAAPLLALDADIAALGGGYFHSCALHDDGAVRCWGDGQYAQLGRGDGDLSPAGDDESLAGLAAIDLGGPVTRLAVGYFHACVVQDGQVRCWGAGTDAQLGYGNTASIGDDEPPSAAGIVDVGGVAQDVTAGFFHSCALLEGGDVRCWGGNADGQLGTGDTVTIGDDELPSAVVPIALGGVAIDVVAGGRHTCALLEGGDVRCWGLGGSGQLGNGTGASIGDDELPGDVPIVDVGGSVVQLSAGFYSTCALLDTAEVRCWGLGAFGGLGHGGTDDIGDDEPPSAVDPIDVGGDVVQIAGSNDHTCALLDTGAVRCWGLGADGRLGYGNTASIGDDEPPSAAGDVPLL